ncbi:MAG: IS4 family transposase [Armatimonadota bacterium]|jgi:hypothetical protein
MTSSSAQQWANDDLATLNLGDERRNRRARQMAERIAQRPGALITAVFEGKAETDAAYRLLNNPSVEPDEIRAALERGTVERLADVEVVLAPQDTTCLDFSGHPATEGLGPTGGPNASGHGMFVHSAIAVSEDGVPLGLLDQRDWARDPEQIGKSRDRKQLPLEEKESYRWVEAVRAVEAAVPADKLLIQIADREGDIFEVFATQRREHSYLLIRAYRERRLKGEGQRLWPTVENQPVSAEYELLVHSARDRAARIALVQLRFCPVTIRPPKNGVHDPSLEPVTLNAIEVREINAPERATPILWRLLTDLPVASAEDALQCVRYYEKRWLIERYHFVLKSGCRIEESQLQTIAGLERLLALLSAVALRLLWMTYSARVNGDAPCTVAFTDLEWQALYRYHRRKAPPDEPPTLAEAVLWLAKLGGFLGRKSDGDPGVKVLWRGILRLHDLVTGFLLASGDVRNA